MSLTVQTDPLPMGARRNKGSCPKYRFGAAVPSPSTTASHHTPWPVLGMATRALPFRWRCQIDHYEAALAAGKMAEIAAELFVSMVAAGRLAPRTLLAQGLCANSRP
jgi:hypothetical protein